jgi:hypothetical protein
VLSAFKKALLHNRFLLALISSSAFKAYFDMLGSCYPTGLLPTRLYIPLYKAFLSTHRPNYSIKTDKVAGGVKVKPDVELAQEEEGEGGEGEEEEEERDPSLFLKFVKTLVVHFTAKRALERYSFRIKDQDVNISLFSVDRSSLAIPAGSWSAMNNMMRALYSDPSSNDTATATKALEILERKVLKTRQGSSPGKYDNLCAKFKLIINNTPILFPGGMHCETVLATLGKYFEPSLGGDESDDKANLTSICKVILLSLAYWFYLNTLH